MHAVQLGLARARLAELDTALLVIVPGTPDQARKIAKLVRATFPVLADPDRTTFRRYGLGRKLVVIQQSGTALVGRDGALAYMHRSISPSRALHLDRLMKAVDAAHGA